MVKLTDAEKRQEVAEEHKAHVHTEEKTKVETKKEKKVVAPIKTNATLQDLGVVFYPLVTEKAVNMIEGENKLTFVVSDKANKASIKKVIESAYGVKVERVNIVRDMRGRKKAIVKLDKAFKAQELATKLGVL